MYSFENVRSIVSRFLGQMQKNDVAEKRGQTEDAHERARVQRESDEIEFARLAADGEDETKAVRFGQCPVIDLLGFPVRGEPKIEAHRKGPLAKRHVEPSERIDRLAEAEMTIEITVPVELDADHATVAKDQVALALIFLGFVENVIDAEDRTVLVLHRMIDARLEIVHHVLVLDAECRKFDEVLDEYGEVANISDEHRRRQIILGRTPAYEYRIGK